MDSFDFAWQRAIVEMDIERRHVNANRPALFLGGIAAGDLRQRDALAKLFGLDAAALDPLDIDPAAIGEFMVKSTSIGRKWITLP